MSSAIVIDHSMFPELAMRLGRDLDQVYYFSPWASAFPEPVEQLIGSGLEEYNVERVDFPLELIGTAEEPDVWVFPDLYFTDLQQHLRKLGKRVWGSGWGELYEQDRNKLATLLVDAKHPFPPARLKSSIDELETTMRALGGGDYIKVAQYYRGLMETYRHRGWPQSKPWLDDLRRRLGPAGAYMQFMVQSAIEGEAVEPGLDFLVVNGQALFPALLGYEQKDSGILSKVITEMPKWAAPVQTVIDHLSDDGPYTNFFSAEIRRTKDESYMTDATCRIPRPVDAIHMEMWENLTDVIVQGAQGEHPQPKPAGKYAAQVILSSDWLRDHPLHVRIPKEIRRNVKLWRFFQDDDQETWCLPDRLHDPAFGSVVSIGDSMEDVMRECFALAKEVEAEDVSWQAHVFDKILEDIERGRANGVDF